MGMKQKLKKFFPWPLRYIYRKLHALPEDFPTLAAFLFKPTVFPLSFLDRLRLVYKCYRVSFSVDCPHMESEILQVMQAIFATNATTKGVIVEAGSFKGGSTAKLSAAAHLSGRKFVVFDSFEGIPEHNEKHTKNIFGGDAYFPPGSYAGSLNEVKTAVKRFGVLPVCEFKKGWFEDTMPAFKEPVIAAYVDVDLESSTKTCLEYLYPLLVKGGVLFSQDGHLPWVIDLINDKKLWQHIGGEKPTIIGLGKKKLVLIKK